MEDFPMANLIMCYHHREAIQLPELHLEECGSGPLGKVCGLALLLNGAQLVHGKKPVTRFRNLGVRQKR